jgi:2'-5' RNA ligase
MGLMRIFAALVPPEPALDDLADFLLPRQEAGGDLRWTQPEQWHVTLAFMAQVRERTLDHVRDAVTRAASRVAPFTLALDGGGAFPHPYDARVLWVGVRGDTSGLQRLARSVRNGCAHAGGDPTGGRFRGHVTLARMRRPLEATRWIRVLEGYAGPPWTAGEVALIGSHLGEGVGGRPRYEVLGLAPLAGG